MADLTLQDVADRLGVHYMTAYRYVRLGKLAAVKRGTSWVVDDADLERFEHGGQDAGDATGDLVTLLLRGDGPAGWLLIEQALASSLGPEQVITDLLAPALRRIGDLWASGDIDVADEHLASATVRSLLGRLSGLFARRGNKRGRVLVAMVEGERHDIGAEMIACLLRGAHYDVVSLSTDTPHGSLTKTVERFDDLDAVILGALIDRRALACAIGAIREADQDIAIFVGGAAGGSDAEAKEMGANGFVGSLGEARSLVESVAS